MKFVVSKMKKTMVAAALAATFSSGAFAVELFPDFTVNEGSVPGAVANTFTADKITGNYVEIFTPIGGNQFAVSLRWNAGQFVADGGTNALTNSTQLNSFGAGGYGMYALYQSVGTFSTVGGVTTFTNTAGLGSLSLYLDPNADTSFTNPANGTVLFGTVNAGDDILIATGVPGSGQGTLDPTLGTCDGSIGGINCGSFGTSSSFILQNPAGPAYFTAPNPFYALSFQSGQLNNFTPDQQQTVNGSLDVVFRAVPEPESIALLGVGLLGMVAGLRRRKEKVAA